MKEEKSLGEMLTEDIERVGEMVEGGIKLKGVGGDVIIGLKEKEIGAEEIRFHLTKAYDLICEIIADYMDIDKKLHPLIACWIIGTYFHNSFPTFPYLFINAMKGSGKTRLLNIIKKLSHKGDLLNSPTEAVLFRTEGTLCIDEFEGVSRKGNENLRELLNSAYKKGTKVKRMRKAKTMEGEQQVVEEFEVYRPIVIANIWGMETVLSDRCLSFILDRSDDPRITRLVEVFDNDTRFETVLKGIGVVSAVYLPCRIYTEWNTYVRKRILTTHTTQTNNYTNNTNLSFYDKVFNTNINGRNLELSLPLFVIANVLGDKHLSKLIKVMNEVIFEKKDEDFLENKDVGVIDFISQEENRNFQSVTALLNKFRSFINAKDDDRWLNDKWFGRALKRLNLVSEKRRLGRGIEVRVDVEKAKNKIRMFKTKDDDENIA